MSCELECCICAVMAQFSDYSRASAEQVEIERSLIKQERERLNQERPSSLVKTISELDPKKKIYWLITVWKDQESCLDNLNWQSLLNGDSKTFRMISYRSWRDLEDICLDKAKQLLEQNI